MNSKITVVYSEPTAEDRKSYKDSDIDPSVLDGRIKAVFTDSEGHCGTLFLKTDFYERLGEEYIARNCKLEYSTFLENWQVEVSENAYYNNSVLNPPVTVPLKFIGIRHSDGSEIYRGIGNASHQNRSHFLRQVSKRENFARWVSSQNYKDEERDCCCRPNITFELNGQTESIKYDDWNGVAAYSDTFNPNFRPKE